MFHYMYLVSGLVSTCECFDAASTPSPVTTRSEIIVETRVLEYAAASPLESYMRSPRVLCIPLSLSAPGSGNITMSKQNDYCDWMCG